MGIDMVRTHRSWSNIDHQWFSSLGNIISICLQLRKAELQAKEDRRALDHSEKILRNIYKNLPVGIELYDKDGYLVDMNDKELEIFGLADMKEALGVSLFENPNIPEDVKEKLRARENVDFSINYDFSKIDRYVTSRRKDVINLQTKVALLYDSQNQFSNYLFINIDTTETTSAYTKIQEFEHLFLLIGDYAKVGFAHFNIMTRDGYAQNTWYRNLGEKENTPMPQVIGVYSHVHPEDCAVLNARAYLGKQKKSQLSATTRLGKRTFGQLEYTYSLRNNWDLSTGYQIGYNDFNLYKEGDRLMNLTYVHHMAWIGFTKSWCKLLVKAGIHFEKYNYHDWPSGPDISITKSSDKALLSYQASRGNYTSRSEEHTSELQSH